MRSTEECLAKTNKATDAQPMHGVAAPKQETLPEPDSSLIRRSGMPFRFTFNVQ